MRSLIILCLAIFIPIYANAMGENRLAQSEKLFLSTVVDGIHRYTQDDKAEPHLPHQHPHDHYSLTSVEYERLKGLAPVLTELKSVHEHHFFFVKYAEILLKMSRSLSTLERWKKVHYKKTIPLNIGKIDSRPFEEEEHEGLIVSDDRIDYRHCEPLNAIAIREKLFVQLGLTEKVLENLSALDDDKMYQQLVSELKDVRKNKRATYRWFILFTTRLGFFAIPKETRKHSFAFTNTGWHEYAFLIEAFDLWKDPKIYEDFLSKVGDEVTLRLRNPLALVNLFPRVIMVPYPFALSINEINDSFPYEKNTTTIHPIGYSNVPLFVDNVMMTPAYYQLHDYQHFANTHVGLTTFATTDPLSEDAKKASIEWLKEGYSLFSSAVEKLQKASYSVKNDRSRRTFQYFIFSFSHEYVSHLWVRMKLLVGKKKNPFYGFYGTSPSAMARYREEYPKYQEFVNKALGSDLLKKIDSWYNFKNFAPGCPISFYFNCPPDNPILNGMSLLSPMGRRAFDDPPKPTHPNVYLVPEVLSR